MDTRLDLTSYLDHTLAEGHALLAASVAAPDAQIAACPAWTNTGLVEHMVGVWSFFIAQIEAGDPSGMTRPSPDPDETPADLLERVVALMRATDPDAPAWNWTDDRRAGWFARRAAHETSVHRWDAQDAAGAAEPLDGNLAADGVSELIDVAMRFSLRGPDPDQFPDGSLHLHRTDGEGEWLLTTDADGALVVTFEHAKGDAAARGTASDLTLFMWGRGRGGLECFGDDALLDAWADVTP